MKIIQKLVTPALLAFALLGGLTMLNSTSVSAACAPGSSAKDCILEGSDIKTGAGDKSIKDLIKIISEVLLFVLGAIAVIMIIVGGIRYTTSNGEASQIKSAKDTILYSIIGVIVAILAYAIVNFVVGNFAP